MTNPYSQERLIAELAVQRASLLTKTVLSSLNQSQGAGSSAISKPDSTPVTLADFAAQALLISALHAAFPSDAFVGEEDASLLRADPVLRQRVWELVSSARLEDEESETLLARPRDVEEMLSIIDLGGRGEGGREGRVWMMDPVDGTAMFLRGEQFAVALALVVCGAEMVGVLGCPNLRLIEGRVSEGSVDAEGLGLMLSAVKGEGAFVRSMGRRGLLAGIKIEKAGEKEMRDLHFVDCMTTKSLDLEMHRRVAERLGAAWPGTDLWSSQMRYAALAVGGGDVMLRIHKKKDKMSCVWDHAGGQLIFREVGGKITDLDGKDIDFGTGRALYMELGMIAARQGIHGRILEVVAEIFKERDESDQI